MRGKEDCPGEGNRRAMPPAPVMAVTLRRAVILAIMVALGAAGLQAREERRGGGVFDGSVAAGEAGVFVDETDEREADEHIAEETTGLIGTPVPLFGVKRAVIQPLIGVAFVAPWIVHLAVSGDGSKKFFKRADELALYLATPLAMSLSVTMAGWLIDRRSYNFFAGFGISTGLGYFLGGMGQLFAAMFLIAPGWWNQSMRTYYIIATAFSGWITIVATVGGDLLGKMVSRRRARLQAALVQGGDGGCSLGVPLPMVCAGGRKGEIDVSLALLYCRF